jgi:hypothetical protein
VINLITGLVEKILEADVEVGEGGSLAEGKVEF